jgi:RNA polymerase sigma factor (sigma-70 family)
MAEIDDIRLLTDFQERGSEEAFAALVKRHASLVRAVALRHLGDVQHAEDVSQTVFVTLGRDSARLRKKASLRSWLYTVARLAAKDLHRSEERRVRREREAFMQSMNDRQEDPAWTELEELLYEGMDRLRESERDVVLARYFEGLPVPEAAVSLGVTEAALKKRLTRGIDQLRKFYAARGVRVSAQGLAGSISANAVQPLSPILLAKLCEIGVHKGAGCSPAVQALAQSTMRALDWLRFKAIAAWSGAVLLAVGTGALAVREAVARPAPPRCPRRHLARRRRVEAARAASLYQFGSCYPIRADTEQLRPVEHAGDRRPDVRASDGDELGRHQSVQPHIRAWRSQSR